MVDAYVLFTVQKLVSQTETPATVASLTADLRALGVTPGMVVLVHSSLSAMGWVCGGPVAVILALQEALGPDGTLVMPTHTSDLTEPSRWENPPVPESWWPVIRESMPAFDPDLTPTRAMGVIPETFRKQAGILRSDHPHVSVCARGPRAQEITADHSLANGLGEDSPLGRLYDLHAHVLLLGVGHEHNTSMHLAEYRADYATKRTIEDGAPAAAGWVAFSEFETDSSDFDRIGEAFLQSEAGHAVLRGRVGLADSQLMPQRDVVDFAVHWLEENRTT